MFSDMMFVKNSDKRKFDFRTKSKQNPLKNVHFLALVKTSIFCSYNVCFPSRITKNHFFWHNFCKKHPYEKFRFFPLKSFFFFHKYPKTIFSDIISVKMSTFWPFLKLEFFPLKIILFFPQYQKSCFLLECLWKRQIRKSSIFGQNPWTNPFKKSPFFGPC